ncbi:MAG: MFS transporter [Coriobacteriales bacterium]|jgi:MFS family permease
MPQARRLHFGYLVVVTLVIMSFIPLSLGISCAGIFYPAISADLGIGRGLLGNYMSFVWIAPLAFLPLIGRLFSKLDARVCLSGGVAIAVVAFVWLSFTRTLWQFYVGGFLMGVSVAILLLIAPSTLINRWFAKRAGFMLGIVMAFTGTGGVVWSPIGGILIQAIGWSATYRVFALLCAVTLPAAIFMVRSEPADLGLAPWGAETDVAGAEDDAPETTAASPEGMTASEAFRSPIFYILLVSTLFLNFGMYLYSMLPSYISTMDIATAMPLLGATASSVAMAGQTISKLVLGFTGDKKPYASVCAGVSLGIVGVVLLATGLQAVALIYAAAFTYGFFYGVTNVMMPILTRKNFGIRDYPRIYARVSMASCTGALVSGFVWGPTIEATGSFTITFTGIIAMMALSIFFLLIVKRKAK